MPFLTSKYSRFLISISESIHELHFLDNVAFTFLFNFYSMGLNLKTRNARNKNNHFQN